MQLGMSSAEVASPNVDPKPETDDDPGEFGEPLGRANEIVRVEQPAPVDLGSRVLH